MYAITWNDKVLCITNENDSIIYNYKDAWDLAFNFIIDGHKFIKIWDDIELISLF